MSWNTLGNYFNDIEDTFIQSLFQGSIRPWDPLTKLSSAIVTYFQSLSGKGDIKARKTTILDKTGLIKDQAYFVEETTMLSEPFTDPEARIYIGEGTLLESGATIKANTIIQNYCEIRQGAYIRGDCYIGEHCTVGHTTEMKNSVFIRHVEAGHFAYVGDTIAGSYVNLGAGTKISNLEFRSFDAKKNDEFPEIRFRYDGEIITTGVSKFGAIIGDGVETGCNCVLSPFVFLEPKCWILPCVCVPKGIYKKRSIIRDKSL